MYKPKYNHGQNVKIRIKGMVEDVPVFVEKELVVRTIDLHEYTDTYSRNHYFKYYLVTDLVFDQNGRWIKEDEIIGTSE